jgi:hypothetical protein
VDCGVVGEKTNLNIRLDYADSQAGLSLTEAIPLSIHFKLVIQRIRTRTWMIQAARVADPYSFDTDPTRIQGYEDQKWKNIYIF